MTKKKILKYLISSVLSIGIGLLIFSLCGGFKSEGKDLFRILSDSTFSTGIIYLAVGLLLLISNSGFFDILGYGMICFFGLFKKDVKDKKYANYLEYKEAKKESHIEWGYLVIIGVLYILVASVFLYLYSK